MRRWEASYLPLHGLVAAVRPDRAAAEVVLDLQEHLIAVAVLADREARPHFPADSESRALFPPLAQSAALPPQRRLSNAVEVLAPESCWLRQNANVAALMPPTVPVVATVAITFCRPSMSSEPLPSLEPSSRTKTS